MNVMRQSAGLMINPITVYSYGYNGGLGLRLNDNITVYFIGYVFLCKGTLDTCKLQSLHASSTHIMF